jgi:hypothetical protein
MDTPEDPLLPFQPQIISEKRVLPQLLFHWESLTFNLGIPSPDILCRKFMLTFRQSRTIFHDCCIV